MVSSSQSPRPVRPRRARKSAAGQQTVSVMTTNVVTGKKSGDLVGAGRQPSNIGANSKNCGSADTLRKRRIAWVAVSGARGAISVLPCGDNTSVGSRASRYEQNG
jgi:hypothetical protein